MENSSGTLAAGDIKPFIGAKDFQLSRSFYVALGWVVNFETPEIAELQLGDSRFYLQNYYLKAWCHNTMLHITVDSANAWYQHAAGVIKSGSYDEAKVNAPEPQDYGALVAQVWDPSGVLLHFAEYTK